MWRFLSGVSKPAQAKGTVPKDRHESRYVVCVDNDKEAGRKRVFQDSWRKLFPWVLYDGAKGAMFCSPCTKNTGIAEPSSSFVIGCQSFRIGNLRKHDNSPKHQMCVQAEKAKNDPEHSAGNKAISLLNKAACEKMKIMFRNAHALAKQGRPFTDFVWICALDRQKGLEIGDTYINDKQCQAFTRTIAEVERQHLQRDLEECTYYSIICDETTDVSVCQSAILYVRYVKSGVVKTNFLQVVPLERACAQNITDAIFQGLKVGLHFNENESVKKLAGFASDGAAVMQGKNNGVAALLKKKQPCLHSVHCLAHRLELTYKDIFSQLQYHSTFHQTLQDLYLFYENSPLNRQMLKESCKMSGVKFMIPKRVDGTRWLAYISCAISDIRAIYPAIVHHLEQLSISKSSTAQAKAKGILSKVKTDYFLKYLHFLCDVLPVLKTLSLLLQQSNVSLTEMYRKVRSTISTLDHLRNEPGLHLGELLRKGSFFGCQLKVQKYEHYQPKCTVLSGIIKSLSVRFSEMNEQLIDNMVFLDIKMWPESNEKGFGNSNVVFCVQSFQGLLQSNNCNTESVLIEWNDVKEFVYQKYEHSKLCTVTWEMIASNFRDDSDCINANRNVLILIDLLLSLPWQSADCERGFSVMKIIKNDWRSKLGFDVLSDLIRITLQSKDIEHFDPTDSVKLWFSSGSRSKRPFTKPYGERGADKD